MNNWNATLIKTAFSAEQFLPESLLEIAVAGRSNAGKSTLINGLFGKKLAHISSKPGKTRSINFYRVDVENPFFLVDLPGYGYAARSRDEKNEWARLIEQYVTNRNSLCLIIHLVDFRHGLLKNDILLQDWLTELSIPILTVFTKVDKIARGKRKQLLFKYVKDGLKSYTKPVLTSSTEKVGFDELRSVVGSYLRNWRESD